MNKRLAKKLAYWLVAGGGTCDVGDIGDVLRDEGVPCSWDDEVMVANLCGEIKDKLYERSLGWEELKPDKSVKSNAG